MMRLTESCLVDEAEVRLLIRVELTSCLLESGRILPEGVGLR